MAKLFLLRHLLSQWNNENRFSGWVDVPLLGEGIKDAEEIAGRVFKNKIDVIYSSTLFRNKCTVLEILKQIGRYPIFVCLDEGKMKKWGSFIDISENDFEVYATEKLNERYYGKIQGLNKKNLMKKYGENQVKLWRRSYEIAPPGGESLRDVYKRVIPFYKKYVERNLKENKNVLIVSSHNPLRAIIKYVENISDKDIVNIEVSYGGLMQYDFYNGTIAKK